MTILWMCPIVSKTRVNDGHGSGDTHWRAGNHGDARQSVAVLALAMKATACGPTQRIPVSKEFEVKKMNEARFTEEHAWVKMDDDGIATVGISDYAQEQLGDIVYVQLPDIGRDLGQGEDCAMIESVKTTSDVKCPIGGRVIEINESLVDLPERVNESAVDDGWLFKLEPADDSEFENLMDADDYEDFVDSQT